MTEASRSPAVLVLAGLDPSGGAGLFADGEAIREIGARPLLVPTALTVQTTRAARGFTPVDAAYLAEAARALLEEEDVRALKIGMLATPAIAWTVLELLEELAPRRLPVVLDPVLASSSGAALFHGTLAEARDAILALAPYALLTPNALEAQLLLELAEPPRDADALDSAGWALLAKGAPAVLIKGGHASGPESIDVLVERTVSTRRENEEGATVLHHLSGPRLPREGAAAGGKLLRGTGCRLASALAAGLAMGRTPLAAAREAKALVARALQARVDPAAR